MDRVKVNLKAIGILGAGQWGTTLALLASKKNPHVVLYDRDPIRVQEISKCRENKKYLPGFLLPEAICVTSNISEVFESCELIYIIVPALALRSFIQNFKSLVHENHFLIHGIKGLEPNTSKRMSEIIFEETKSLQIGVLSGPNLAIELAQNLPAATVIASKNSDVIKKCQDALACSQLRIYGNSDVIGVEWAGALKNILAIAAGVLFELKLGQNALAMLLTRGVAEIGRFLVQLEAQPSTLLGLSGIGDIIATCTSPLSRNFRAGQLLVKGKSKPEIEKELAMTIEGFNTVQVAIHFAHSKGIEMPITQSLYKVIFQNYSLTQAIQELMERPSSFESIT